MKRRNILLALALGTAGMLCATAEEPEGNGLDLTGDMEGNAPAMQTAPDSGKGEWYVDMDYADFEFQLPAGVQLDKGSNLLAKYPDGSFGMSMINEHVQGACQTTAYETCRKLAEALRLPGTSVEKVKYGKCGGAKATGNLEGQEVTVLVLPYDNEQVTAVIIANPERKAWSDQFLRTLKR